MNGINNEPDAPRWPRTFLRWICPPALFETIEGDLLEKFESDITKFGEQKARRRFVRNTLEFFRLSILIRNKIATPTNRAQMMVSYLRAAGRRLLRTKAITMIHFMGLSTGTAAFLLILYYVSFEQSFDRSYGDQDQIYRLAYSQFENGQLKSTSAKNFAGISALVKEYFPEVKACTGFDRTALHAYFLFSYQGKKYYEQDAFYQTDSDFFKVFPSLLLKGDPSSVLQDPHHIVLSEKIARKVFGNTDPIGKRIENGSLSYSDVSEFVVSGVMKDQPANSHFHVNFIAQNSHADELAQSSYWKGPTMYTYLTLAPGTDPDRLSGRFNRFIDKLESENRVTRGSHVMLQPISDIHLRSHLQDELEANGNEDLVSMLSIIGVIILVLAWINYINIEIARFLIKRKSFSVRRILGAFKIDLALESLVEYSLLAGLSAFFAMVLLALARPFLSSLIDVQIPGFLNLPIEALIKALGLFIGGSFVAGIYPALFLSKINPIVSLTGSDTGRKTGKGFRQSLFLIQFSSAFFLVAIVMVIYSQLDFMLLTNKKIDLDKIISIRNPSVYTNADDSVNYSEFQMLKNKLLEGPHIKAATSASIIPGTAIDEHFTDRLKINITAPRDPISYGIIFVDYDFIPFYHLKLIAGRNYSIEQGDEENWNRIILNESAIYALGFQSITEAINHDINFHLWGDGFQKYTIVGIIEDYHQEAIKNEVTPVILSLNHSRFQQVFYSVKFGAHSNPHEALVYTQQCWEEVFPDKPFVYFFQDDFYDQQFRSERRTAGIFSIFSGIAVFLASLGILGITLFEANSRLKEISIRKVLGATLSSLLGLLSRDYMKLIVVSSAISVPLAYAYASQWLKSYPFRIAISPWFFLIPFFGMVFLILAVSGFLTWTATKRSTVDQLKSE